MATGHKGDIQHSSGDCDSVKGEHGLFANYDRASLGVPVASSY